MPPGHDPVLHNRPHILVQIPSFPNPKIWTLLNITLLTLFLPVVISLPVESARQVFL